MLLDLRYALRLLLKAPLFTIVAVVTLSVGIGSATIVFSAINGILLRPLPFVKDEERLLYFSQTDSTRGPDEIEINYADFRALQSRMTTLEGIWVHHDRTVIFPHKDGRPERLWGTEISHDAFAHLGVNPIRGRPFAAADADLKNPEVALLSYNAWQRYFGGEDEIIDTTITLSGQQVAVIGVMPKGWGYPDSTDVWLPMRREPAKAELHGYYELSGRAKMKPGVTVEQVQAEANAVMGALAQEFPDTNNDIGVHFRPIREEAVEDTRDLTVLLFGAVMFVFLIACANVANLLLARAVTRSKEIAIRLALGADRSRIVRQLVTESIVLALIGGVGGLIFGLWGVDAMKATFPMDIPFWMRFDFDLHVFVFVSALSLLAAIVFGLVPALKATRADLVSELKEGGRTSDDQGAQTSRTRHLLVVAEIALALVLLVGAGLMVRSFLQLRSINPGFDARNVLTFRTGFPQSMLDEKGQVSRTFFAELLPRLAALPGVESAAVVSYLPGKDEGLDRIRIEGRTPAARPSDRPLVYSRSVSPNYFSTVRILLKAGRGFDPLVDHPDSPHVAIVDEAFAQQHFGGNEQALGQRIRGHDSKEASGREWHEIVGVVGSIRHKFTENTPQPTVYVSSTQSTGNFMSVVMRTKSDPATYSEVARAEVLSVNRQIPIYWVRTLDEELLRLERVWQQRFFSHVFALFGLVALFLACIGIYGVMSYSVTQRMQELGVRLALGAQPQAVIRMVVQRGLKLVGWGVGVGFVAALLLAQLLTGFLYGVSPHDPPTFAAVPALLGAVAVLACYLPSRRATRIDPVVALRAE